MPPTETVKDNLVLNTRRASNGCVEWQGATNAGGYGILHWGLAHRLSYTLFIGPIPRGRCVLHTCDNRRCVRPSHLWIGSLADNIRDMDKKGRRRVGRGEKHASAKVTEALVREIRASYKPGRPGIDRKSVV